MDSLAYSYDAGNKLLRVADAANDAYGFTDDAVAVADAADDYSYDANGNLLTDTNKNITGVTYNHLNLPTQTTIGGQNISYLYTADGVKQRKTANGITTDYAGNVIYENSSLKFINHAEGYLEPAGAGVFRYVFQYKDHLGNIRLSYSDLNGNGLVNASEIIEENNYYPFGMKHKGYNGVVNGTPNTYKTFQGQEFTDAFGLNVHEWKYRFGDPATGRFWQIDPLAEEYVYNSTYAFAENKVMMGNELEGLELGPTHFEIYQSAKIQGRPMSEVALELTGTKGTESGALVQSTIMDFIPGLGDVKGVIEGIKGTDMLTGEPLSGFERAMGFALLSEVKIVGKLDDASTVLKNAEKVKNLAESEAKGIPKTQLGPSGKPKVHNVNHKNLKSAKDGAGSNNPKSNSKPIKHSSDKGQKTHYHSTKNGKKLDGKDNVHHVDRSSKKNPN